MHKLRVIFAAAVLWAPIVARAQAHSVTLTWTLSASSGVTAQNVYRVTGACPASGGLVSPAQIASVTPIVTTYVDSNVAAGATYCYAVTALNGSLAPPESPQSNLAQAVVPADATTGPVAGDVLIWDGSKWTHVTPSTPIKKKPRRKHDL